MIPTVPRLTLHDPSVPKPYLVARNAFTLASMAMAALALTMIVLGIVNDASWGAADGTGFVVPAWLVIALACIPPVAAIVLVVNLTWERVNEIIAFLTPTAGLFVMFPIAFSLLYPDASGVHWDPNDRYWDDDDPRAKIGWHWIAAFPQVVTFAALWAGIIRKGKRYDAERAAVIAEWNRKYGE